MTAACDPITRQGGPAGQGVFTRNVSNMCASYEKRQVVCLPPFELSKSIRHPRKVCLSDSFLLVHTTEVGLRH